MVMNVALKEVEKWEGQIILSDLRPQTSSAVYRCLLWDVNAFGAVHHLEESEMLI